MTLTLAVLRCPDRATPERRRLEGGELVLGRGPGADWILSDPADKPLLSRKHCLVAYRAGAWTVTDSSTNGTFLNGEALPAAAPSRALRDGDRLRLGAYEIEVGLTEPAPAFAAGPFPSAFEAAAPAAAASFDDDPFAPAPVRLPDDFLDELIAPPAPRPFTQPDHSPAQSDVIRPPRPQTMLPAAWDDAEPAAEAPEPVAPAAPPAHAASAQPAPAGPPDDGGLLAAFLAGAGLAESPADPAAAMQAAGAAFRAFVHGLRQVLIARAEVKSAFRIDQTMIRAKRNNPLKFAPSDEDALAALLGLGRRGDMAPAEAVAGALTDIRLHELATMAALQQAVRDLLDRLEPARFRAAAEGGMLPAQRRARAFDLYEADYKTMREALTEKFDDAFGRAFAAAYERVTADLQAREPLGDW